MTEEHTDHTGSHPKSMPEPKITDTTPPQPLPHTEKPKKKLLSSVKKIGSPIPGKLSKLKRFVTECKRVLRVTKKPNKEEFLTIVKISSIGMAVIGLIGFAVFFLKELIFG